MATVTKDFRVKAGLIVEGSTATVNSHDILTEALVDAKGDLLVASAADTVTRLAAGTNGYVLTANTSATNGIEWAAPAAVGEFASSITFEGATANDNETTLQVTDPTADRTITLPDATGQVVLRDTTDTLTNKSIALSGNTVTGSIADFNTALTDADFATLSGTETLANKTISSPTVSGLSLSDASIVFEGATANDYETTLTVTDPTADRTITLPNVSGTVVTTGDTGSVTNGMLAGSIANDKLSNSAITINGTSTSLGGSRTLGSDDIAEGSTNKYFTDERAQDAIGDNVGNGLDYDDATGAISVDPSEFTLNSIGAPSAAVALNSQKITGLATPTDSTDASTKGYVDGLITTEVSNRNTAISTAVSNLVDGAPDLLNTLNELAAAINDDANYTTTITTALGTKAPLASPDLTGVPTAPTAAANTNTTQIATTAFAKAEADAAQSAAEATASGDATSKANAAQAAAEATASSALSGVTAGTTAFTAVNVNSVAKQIAATTGNHTEVAKIMVTLDSSDNVYITEYGMSSTSGVALQTVSADVSGTDVRIRVTPANNNTEVLITGTLLV
jgi:hypothetical protein